VKVQMIAAVAKNGVIGRGGRLAWHVPEDLAHFRRTTMGHVLILGRRTFESLPGILPGRPHVVVSRTGRVAADGVTVVRDLADAFEAAAALGDRAPFVAGGAQLYEAAYPFVQRIVLTRIPFEVEGDTYLPAPPAGSFRRTDRRSIGAGCVVEIHERVAQA